MPSPHPKPKLRRASFQAMTGPPNTCETGFTFYRCADFSGCCNIDPCSDKNPTKICPSPRSAMGGTSPSAALAMATSKTDRTVTATVSSGTLTKTAIPTMSSAGMTTSSGVVPTTTEAGNGTITTETGVAMNDTGGDTANPPFPTSIVAGAVIGGLVVLGLLAFAGWWCIKRRRQAQDQVPEIQVETVKDDKEAQSMSRSGSGAGSQARSVDRRWSSATTTLMRMSMGRKSRRFEGDVKLGPPPGGPVGMEVEDLWGRTNKEMQVDKETGTVAAQGNVVPKTNERRVTSASTVPILPRGTVENPRGGVFEDFGGRYRSPRQSLSTPALNSILVSPLSPSESSYSTAALPVSPVPPSTVPELDSADVLEAEGSAATGTRPVSSNSLASSRSVVTFNQNVPTGLRPAPVHPSTSAPVLSFGSRDQKPAGESQNEEDGQQLMAPEDGGKAPCRATLNATKMEWKRGVHVASWGRY